MDPQFKRISVYKVVVDQLRFYPRHRCLVVQGIQKLEINSHLHSKGYILSVNNKA